MARMNADLMALVFGIPLLLMIVTMALTWQQMGEYGAAMFGGLVFVLAVGVLYYTFREKKEDDAPDQKYTHTHVNCHCGRQGTIAITSSSETGWYECDCGCAWRYVHVDVGNRIELLRVRNCPSTLREASGYARYPEEADTAT